MRLTIYVLLIGATLLSACKNKSDAFDVSESDVFEAPTSDAPSEKVTKRPTSTKSTTTPAPEQTRKQTSGGTLTGGDLNAPRISNPNLHGDVKNKFWSKKGIYYFDHVGGMGDLVYEEIKGQPYYTSTVILVYATDAAMEGTTEYTRVEQTLKSTRLDDRIFIWVHFDKDKNVKFVNKLVSDNIKGDMPDANYKL